MNLSPPFAGNHPITQKFGENPQYYAIYGLPAHNGIDYGINTGTPILAAADGYVSEVNNDPKGYGIYVKVIHAQHYTLYAHLSSFCVELGQGVVMGDRLGLSGNTGNSTGPHLHFGLRLREWAGSDPWHGWIDPAPHLVDDDDSYNPADSDTLRTLSEVNIRTSPVVGDNHTGYRIIAEQVRPYDKTHEDGGDIWAHIDIGWIAVTHSGWVLAEVIE